MQDEVKSKEQLISELHELRMRVAEFEKEREDRKQAEKALKASEGKYRELVQNANSIILRMDSSGKVTFCNEFAHRFFGYSAGEILGSNVIGTIVPELESTGRDLRTMIEDIGVNPDKYINNINENMLRNGERVWIAWTNKPILDNKGQVVEILCIGNDFTESKRMEEKLLESEAKYRLISENTGDVIWQFDLKTNQVVYVSPSVHRLLGFTPEELVGQSMEAVLTPASMQFVSKRLPEVIAALNAGDESVRVLTHEVDQVRKDGSIVPTEVVTTLLQEAQGQVAQIIGVTRDITVQRHADEAQRESETKFRALFGAIMEGVALHEIVCDQRGIPVDYSFVSTNPAFEKHMGLKSEQVVGQLGSKIFGLGRAPHLARFARVATSGQPDSFETYFALMNRYLRISATSPKPGYFVTVFENITERKQADDALKESQQQLANIIDFLPDATFVIDNEGKVIAWNKAIEEMTGVKAPDMLGKGNYEYALPFYGERRPILIDLVIKPQEEVLSKYGNIARMATQTVGEGYVSELKAGKTYIYGTASVLHDSVCNIVGAIESIRDITKRKKVEEELSAKTRRLEEFNAALKVLLRQREEDRTELEESILSNVKSLIVPYVEKLKKSRLGADQMTYLTILESHMQEITSPFTKRLSAKYLGLTPLEVQTVGLIKDGKTTKEIAESLCVSENTVSSHRFHIRKKLGLSNKKVNLRYYLQSIDK